MSVPVEQGYDGCMEQIGIGIGLNLKATELRLGLPGSESPERDNGLSMLKTLVSGAKRGFSDAIHIGVSGNWVLSGGSEMGLSKDGDGGFFSPKAKAGSGTGAGVTAECTNQHSPLPAVKETVPHSPKPLHDSKSQISAAKAQVVGWPPIRSFRKNSMATQPQKNADADAEAKSGCLYIKVSMEGAPYLRKVDLNTFSSYRELSSALEKMFSCFTISQYSSYGVCCQENLSESRLMDLLHGSEYVLTYEDKDGDWMLVGDVPWEMFTNSCKRLRIMKSSEAIGLAPRSMEKCKSQN